MNLDSFKLVKNRQRPDFCFSYELKTDEHEYQIFTIDGGRTFVASIDDQGIINDWHSEFPGTFYSIQKCLDAFNAFNQNELNKHIMERLMKEITEWSKIYELNFQFWPNQCACYIYKDGVELRSIGGDMEVRQVIEYTCQYLRKINPKPSK